MRPGLSGARMTVLDWQAGIVVRLHADSGHRHKAFPCHPSDELPCRRGKDPDPIDGAEWLVLRPAATPECCCARRSDNECLFVPRGLAGWVVAQGRMVVARPGSGLPEEPVAGA